MFISLVVVNAIWAQDDLQCRIKGEIVPEWICAPWTDEHMVMSVGSGGSFLEAVSSALVNIASTLQTTLVRSDKKSKESIQIAKISLGKNITVQNKIRMTNGIFETTSVVSINKGNDLIFKKYISVCEDKTVCQNYKDRYRINIEGDLSKNIEKIFEKAGIVVLKTYVNSNHELYVMIAVDKNSVKNQSLDW